MDGKLPLLTVSQLTEILKKTIKDTFFGLTVEGEVSGFKVAPTGHWYFSLKDSGAVIGGTIWRSTASRIGFIPKDGQKVIVTGYIDIYEPRGTYSIICTSIRLSGEGDILAKLEERKRKYAQMGYFDEDKKRKIPSRPNRVAVITSPTGAALQDILQITGRRAPGMDIIILPALVQGDEAAPTIAARIAQVNEYCLADVMIVGRGGGSIEDLLPFSEDCVIEAIYKSEIPVISAVGHEIDWAISDFAADLRAPTPSAAAELVCQDQGEQIEKVADLKESLKELMQDKIDNCRAMLEDCSPENLIPVLTGKLDKSRMLLDSAIDEAVWEIQRKTQDNRSQIEILKSTLQALSPKAVLDRGYAIVSVNGKTLTKADEVEKGREIDITLKNGKLSASVKEVKNG